MCLEVLLDYKDKLNNIDDAVLFNAVGTRNVPTIKAFDKVVNYIEKKKRLICQVQSAASFIRKLPAKQHRIAIMYYVKGETAVTIAKELSMSIRTVFRHLEHIKNMYKEAQDVNSKAKSRVRERSCA